MTEQLVQLIILKTVTIRNLIRKFLHNPLLMLMFALMAAFLFYNFFIGDDGGFEITDLYQMLYLGFCLIPIAAWFVTVPMLRVSDAEAVHFLAGNVVYRNLVKSEIVTTQLLMLFFSGLTAFNIMLLTDQGPEMLLRAFLALYSFSSICAWGWLLFFTQRILLRFRHVAAVYLVLGILFLVSLAEAFHFFAVQESAGVPLSVFPLNIMTSPMMMNGYIIAFNGPASYLVLEFIIAAILGVWVYTYPYSIVPDIDNVEPAPAAKGGQESAQVKSTPETAANRHTLPDTGEGELALDGYFGMERRPYLIAMTIIFSILVPVYCVISTATRFYLLMISMITFMQIMPVVSNLQNMQVFVSFPSGIRRLIVSVVKNSVIGHTGVVIIISFFFLWMNWAESWHQIIVLVMVVFFVPWIIMGSAFLSVDPYKSIASPSVAMIPISAALLLPNITLFYIMTFDPFNLGPWAPLMLGPLLGTLSLSAIVAYRSAVADWPKIFSDDRNLLKRSIAMLTVSSAISVAIFFVPRLI